MNMEWPTCTYTSRLSNNTPDVRVQCRGRATRPCGKCGQPLCEQHVIKFDEVFDGRYMGFTRTIFLCDKCVKDLVEQ